jgi:hypothetical protein
VRSEDDDEDEVEEVSATPSAASELPPYFAAIPALSAAPPPRQPAAVPRSSQPTQQHAAPPPPRSKPATGGGGRPPSAAGFKKQREELTAQLFAEFNRTVFAGRLPDDLAIRWNARLLTTAGLTHYRRDIPADPYAPPMCVGRGWGSLAVLINWEGGSTEQQQRARG